jgi:hypothetical protein
VLQVWYRLDYFRHGSFSWLVWWIMWGVQANGPPFPKPGGPLQLDHHARCHKLAASFHELKSQCHEQVKFLSMCTHRKSHNCFFSCLHIALFELHLEYQTNRITSPAMLNRNAICPGIMPQTRCKLLKRSDFVCRKWLWNVKEKSFRLSKTLSRTPVVEVWKSTTNYSYW